VAFTIQVGEFVERRVATEILDGEVKRIAAANVSGATLYQAPK
jgi:hypothetical protein